jgi:hypothetical protein
VLERVFDAPRELVFKMFKEPEHLKRWWGPRGWELQALKTVMDMGMLEGITQTWDRLEERLNEVSERFRGRPLAARAGGRLRPGREFRVRTTYCGAMSASRLLWRNKRHFEQGGEIHRRLHHEAPAQLVRVLG